MPFQIMGNINSPLNYDVTLCSGSKKLITTGGFSVLCPGNLNTASQADTIIIPAFWPFEQTIEAEVIEAIQCAYNNGARIVTICLGAFVLAATGLLNGKRATTHWRHTKDLMSMYPKINVIHNTLFVDDGQIITGAGVAAGIDVCLYLIEMDHGFPMSERISRALVADQRRYDSSYQYLPLNTVSRSLVSVVKRWAIENLHQEIAIADLASIAKMSERSFSRNFRCETGISPMKWVNKIRVREAAVLLRTTDLSVDLIAEKVGLINATNLRRNFFKEFALSPTGYKKNSIISR